MTVFAFLLALWSPAALQATDVRVTPLFWTGQEKPGFKIQCRNDSQSARHRLDYIVKGAALRLDGDLHERQGAFGSFLGPAEVAAGEIFTQLVLFGQGPRVPLETEGPYVTSHWAIPLTLGEHRIAFRCGSDWSAEVAFLWGGP